MTRSLRQPLLDVSLKKSGRIIVTPVAVKHCPTLKHTQTQGSVYVCMVMGGWGGRTAEEFRLKCVVLTQKVAFRRFSTGELQPFSWTRQSSTSFRATVRSLRGLQPVAPLMEKKPSDEWKGDFNFIWIRSWTQTWAGCPQSSIETWPKGFIYVSNWVEQLTQTHLNILINLHTSSLLNWGLAPWRVVVGHLGCWPFPLNWALTSTFSPELSQLQPLAKVTLILSCSRIHAAVVVDSPVSHMSAMSKSPKCQSWALVQESSLWTTTAAHQLSSSLLWIFQLHQLKIEHLVHKHGCCISIAVAWGLQSGPGLLGFSSHSWFQNLLPGCPCRG